MTTLADWLAGEHDLAERLELIDNLCRALDEFHERAPRTPPALEPGRITVSPEASLALSAADARNGGHQTPEYRAPEIVAGAPYTPAADTYSVAVLSYEILSGRHPFVVSTPQGDVEAAPDTPPKPLAELRRELPRDLAEAVMPCLERDPEWRPKDLSYLVEMLRKARQALPAPRRRAATKPAAPRPAAAKPAAELPRPASPLSGRATPSPSTRVPLIAAAVVGLGAVLGGLWYLTQPREAAAPAAAVPGAAQGATAPAPAEAGGAPSEPGDSAATAPLPAPTRIPASAAPPDASAAASTPAAVEAPAPSNPQPTSAPTAAPPAATPVPQEPVRAAAASPRPEAARPATARVEAPAEPAAPARPAVLSTLVPARLRRGATTLVDVRGSDLRADLQPRILFKGREEAAGIQLLRQRCVDPTLLTIMLKIDAQAREGSYTLVLTDAQGNVSNARTFEIGR